MSVPIDCWIYKSRRKDEMYLYLANEGDFDPVPAELLGAFGAPQFVMRLTLSPQRPLARVDVDVVIAKLRQQGFYLQTPPKLEPTLYHGNDD